MTSQFQISSLLAVDVDCPDVHLVFRQILDSISLSNPPYIAHTLEHPTYVYLLPGKPLNVIALGDGLSVGLLC